MRLIDADTLPKVTEYCVDEAGFYAKRNVVYEEDIKKAPTIDPATLAPRWVSVEERLPEQRGAYLVATEDDDVYDAEFVPSVKQWWIDDDLRLDVTHWQPLPDPPKEGENNA